MTKRTSLSKGHTLNSSAFRANAGMSTAKLITSSVPLWHQTDHASGPLILAIGAKIRKPAPTWISHRRVSSMLSP